MALSNCSYKVVHVWHAHCGNWEVRIFTRMRRDYGKQSKYRRTSDSSYVDSISDWTVGFFIHRRSDFSVEWESNLERLHCVLHNAGRHHRRRGRGDSRVD